MANWAFGFDWEEGGSKIANFSTWLLQWVSSLYPQQKEKCVLPLEYGKYVEFLT